MTLNRVPTETAERERERERARKRGSKTPQANGMSRTVHPGADPHGT